MSRRSAKKRERGAILMIALVFIMVLTLLGAVAMRQVQQSIDVAGAERQSDQAFYLAEAGLEAARAMLLADHWDGTNDKVDIAGLFAAPSMAPTPFTAATALVSAETGELAGWQEYGSAVTYPTESPVGTYRWFFKDDVADGEAGDDVPTVDTPNDTILLRVLGKVGTAKRMLEVAVTRE